jgi:heat shock protein HspQ
MNPFEPFERPRSLPAGMGQKIDIPLARFAIGDVVRHKMFDFRGVIFDVDPVFANSDEWYEAIPEAIRPSKDQPYVAYVSQQNLVPDGTDEPVDHPAITTMFDRMEGGRYHLRPEHRH